MSARISTPDAPPTGIGNSEAAKDNATKSVPPKSHPHTVLNTLSRLGSLLRFNEGRKAMEQLATIPINCPQTQEGRQPSDWTSQMLITRILRDLSLTEFGRIPTDTEPLPQTRAEGNQRLASALATLLSSFPNSEMDRLQGEFPQLDFDEENGRYDIPKHMEESGFDEIQAPIAVQTELTELMEKAIDEVGGAERAMILLQYPGLAQTEDLDKVRPVRESWFQTALDANTYDPQMGLGITVKLGEQIVRDILRGQGTWEDVLFAYVDRPQMKEEKNLVAKLHAAHRQSPSMPEGHSHPGMQTTIPDRLFQALWRQETGEVMKTAYEMSKWAEEATGKQLPTIDGFTDDYGVAVYNPAIAERLQVFFTDPAFQPYVQIMLRLYEASSTALDSSEGLLLQREQRDFYNTRKPRDETKPLLKEETPEEKIATLIEGATSREAQRLALADSTGIRFPTNLGYVFTNLMRYGGMLDLEYSETQ
ncbi:MAG TPA: hypothetical protein VEW42_00985 [Candidatus Eisenbacteria bacterium]|nr:hypothetical protein [Candidatus Eisenbacteria bacterium]